MASRGSVQIEITADTSKFLGQLERELKAAIKGVHVQPVKVDGDTSGFTNSVDKATKDADKSFSTLWKDLKEKAATAGTGVGTAFGAALAPAIGAAAGPALQGLVSVLASIGPAALAGIPVAVGVLGTLKVALFGVGETLKQLVDGDLEKFEKELAKLSPVAQSTFRALQGLGPEISGLKNTVQDRFFAGFDKDLTATAKNLLGPVTLGMTGVAGRLNGLVHTFAEYAASSKGADAVVGIFRTTSQVLDMVTASFGPLLDKLLDFIIAGTDAKKVAAAFDEAKTTLKGLATVAGNVKDALGSIFKGFTPDATSAVDALVRGSAALKDFLATAGAQEGLKSLGKILSESQGTLGQILSTLPELLPALANVASGGFGVLAVAIDGVVTAAKPFVEFLADNPAAARALGVAIGTIVVALKAYQAWQVAATAALTAWKAVTVAATATTYAFGVALRAVELAVALASIQFYRAGAAVTVAAAALWAQVAALAAVAAGWARTAVAAALNTARLVAYVVATNAVKVATIAWTAVQWLLNAAMTANPIGIVIAIIVALVAALILAYQKSDTFRAIVDAAFKAIASAAIWLWENALKPLWDGIVWGFDLVVAAGKLWWSAVQAYFGFVAAAATALWGWIKAAWQGIVDAFNFVVDGASAFVASVIAFFERLVSSISTKIGELIGFVKSIPGKILSAIGDLGSLLYNAGISMINGLINGILNAVPGLRSALGFVTNLIPDWKGPEDRDRRLLVPAGQAIMQGLQAGIGSEQQALQQQLAGVTQSIQAAPMGVQARGGDGASADTGGVRVWSNQSSGALGTLVIESDGTAYSELLVRELSKAIRVKGGVVQKVLGKSDGGVA